MRPERDAPSPSRATTPRNPVKQSAAKPEPESVLPADESDEPEDLDDRIASDPVPLARRRQRAPVDDEEPVPLARRKKRARVDDEVADEPSPPEVRPVRRRKKRRQKKRKHSDDISTGQVLAVIAGVMIIIWLGLGALVFFVPASSFIVWLLARIGCAICMLVVRYLARQEGVGTWLMVIFIPFYDIYFAIRYPKEAAGAVVLQYFSMLILFTVGMLRLVHDFKLPEADAR